MLGLRKQERDVGKEAVDWKASWKAERPKLDAQISSFVAYWVAGRLARRLQRVLLVNVDPAISKM